MENVQNTMLMQNSFAVRLLSQLPQEENSVVSPMGIAEVLAMAANGASGETERELRVLLGIKNRKELNHQFQEQRLQDKEHGIFTSRNELTVVGDLTLDDDYAETMRSIYEAYIYKKDSADDPQITLKNVATFHGKWQKKLKEDRSKEIMFRCADGKRVHPFYLKMKMGIPYYNDGAVEAVSLLYRSACSIRPDYEMLLVKSADAPDAQLLDRIGKERRIETVRVAIPAFQIESSWNLKPVLKELGVERIFDKYRSELTRMCDEPMYAEGIGQKAKIQVDAEGTIAEAITFMTAGLTSGARPKKIVDFVADRPFYYFVRNARTGAVLFAGKLCRAEEI